MKKTQFLKLGLSMLLLLAVTVSFFPCLPVYGVAGWTLTLINGMTTYPLAQGEFEALPQVTIHVTDMHGTHDWSGVPIWHLAAIVDGSSGTFNEVFAATNYSVKGTASDGYTRCVGPTASATIIAHNDNLIVANLMDGTPLPESSAPLKIVGTDLISSRFVSKLSILELVYIVNIQPSVNGVITAIGNPADVDGVVGVSVGVDQSFAVIPNPEYAIDHLTVDGGSSPAAPSYTFNAVTANHTLAATFVTDPQPAWDLNNDHDCDILDVSVLGTIWGSHGAPGWIPQDLNHDGDIDILDVSVLGTYWGQHW